MNNLKKIGKYIIIASGVYLFLYLFLNDLIPFFTIFLILISVIFIYIFITFFYIPNKNNSIFYKNIDYKNDPDYEGVYDDEELGELTNIFSIEFVNPKKVDVTKVILPYNRINIILDYYTDQPLSYVSESANGYNSEKLNSEIEKALMLYENKNNFDTRFYIFSEIAVFKGKNDEINIGINNEET